MIELHCGDDYGWLGAFQQALTHYEATRAQLSARHDVATTGKVYAGLGYLIYAALSTSAAPPYASALSSPLSPERIEHDYQRANSFLHQGVSFYQASSDHLKEANTRLMLEALSHPSPPWEAAKQALTLSAGTLQYYSPSLPRFADLPSERSDSILPCLHHRSITKTFLLARP